MEELLKQLGDLGETFWDNAQKQLTTGNKAAGLRARRATLDMEPLLKRFRKLSLEASDKKTSSDKEDSADNE